MLAGRAPGVDGGLVAVLLGHVAGRVETAILSQSFRTAVQSKSVHISRDAIDRGDLRRLESLNRVAKVSMWDPELGSFIRTLSELGENLKVGIPWIGRSLTSTTGDRCRTDQVEFHLPLKLLRQISHWESMPQTSAPPSLGRDYNLWSYSLFRNHFWRA